MSAGNLTSTSGHTDLVTVNQTDGTVSVLRNTSTGSDAVSYAPAVDLPVRESPSGSEPRSLALLDLDEDGDLDLVVVSKNEQDDVVARVLRNDQAGGQLAFAPATDLDAGTDPVMIVAADLNGDQRQDLVALNASLAKDGSPSGQVVIRLNRAASAVGDLDGDGDVDIDDFSVFAGCAGGPGGSVSPECADADLDRDTDVDLADFAEFQALFGGQ